MRQTWRFSGACWLPIVLLLALGATSCRSQGPAASPATPTPTVEAVQPALLPVVEAVALIEPEAGGLVRLRGGAEISLPPQALSARTTVTLRTLEAAASAPIPRSQIGATYEFTLEGSDLASVALVRLPLPAGAPSDQYDLAPYRWNGSAWERINGRLADGVVQFGVDAPGIFALQGTWRLADATLALIKPNTPAAQTRTPIAVAGQYRFSALPALSGEYIQARLTLKQDISGGAGRVTGNPALDSTVAETPLRLQPDPAQAQGVINFSHVFEIAAKDLEAAPGSTLRLYAVLEVADSSAPTRRLSTGIDYTQTLPIQIVDMAVERPELATEGQYALRWRVQFNGQPFLLIDALSTRLPLEDILAQGGLGDYRFALEAEVGGAWVQVSNEVAVQLALRPTEAPAAGQEAAAGGQATVSTPTPGAGGPTPDASSPATPTRRPTPAGGGPAPTATATPDAAPTASAPTASPTRPAWAAPFWADRYIVTPGQCAALYWQVDNVIEVFLDGRPVTGRGTSQVCPAQTTSYVLQVRSSAGWQEFTLPITVSAQGQAAIEFVADQYRVAPSQCTVLRWRVTDVRAVYLNDQGVAGEASQQVCPAATTDYVLRVESTAGATTLRTIRIEVSTGAIVDMRFWAEQYTLRPSTCTTLFWSVRNVREVFLEDAGVAGEGSRQVCPNGPEIYVLSAVTNDGQKAYRSISLTSGDPNLGASEVIAQGLVNDVTRQADLDPVTPGEQPGYRLVIDGVKALFTGTGGWSQAAVTLNLPQAFLDDGVDDLVSWPINPGQWVEFRAGCEGATCTLQLALNSYLYLRSQ